MPVELVATFSGAYSLQGGTVVLRFDAPSDPPALLERLRIRRDGRRTPEEEALLAATQGMERFTHDRRLVVQGVRLESRPETVGSTVGLVAFDPNWRRLLLEDARESLARSWDRSIHVDEAVRSIGDLDEVLNLLAERLESWDARSAASPTAREEADAALPQARRELGELRNSAQEARTNLERALETATPKVAPNLSALLGPLLAARLISRAGGLTRLARLPASTIQVLGAERAFFDHLRKNTPPPRHGVLFIHPEVQGAPRAVRGRIARALAGKAAIAARLDLEGKPVDPRLASAFEERSRRARAARPPRAR